MQPSLSCGDHDFVLYLSRLFVLVCFIVDGVGREAVALKRIR